MQFDLRYQFSQIPIVKICIPFIIGITIGLYTEHPVIAFTLLMISVGALLLFNRKRKKVTAHYKQNTIASILKIVAIGCLGTCICILHKQVNLPNHFSKYIIEEDSKQQKQTIKVQILKPIVEKEKSIKIVAQALEIESKDTIYQCTGKILIYLQKNEPSIQLKYGDQIFIHSYINEINPPQNPNQFDYKNYLSYQNIYNQIYADSLHWKLSARNQGNTLLSKMFNLRHHLRQVIDENINGKKQQAVAQAILIGNKDQLDQEIVRSYSSSGAMHVLAVSGLHVGIVYLVFNFILSILSFLPKYRIIKPILLILLIWFYAIITGASPSVLRAATMFTFITIGTNLQRHTNIYNVIAASALLLLIINPFLVTEVGFQLSYFAVIGIIFLQPKIYRLLSPKNWLLDKIWALTAVSIAAQIATFPLGVLYFHQFPNLFWLSNLIVIPAATIILYLGTLLFALSWSYSLSTIIGKVLSYIILLLNKFVGFIDSVPYALTDKMDITHFQTLLIYLFIILFSIALAYRQKKLLALSMTTLLFFSISYSYKMMTHQSQKQLIVYASPKYSAIEFITGQNSFSQIDSVLLKDEKQMLFNIKHNWWEKHIQKQEFDLTNIPNMDVGNNKLLLFEGKKILLIDSIYSLAEDSFMTDYVIVSHNPKLYLNNFSNKVLAKKYIFDASNPKWKIKYWKVDCENLGLDCYFVTDNLAFIENW